jgi:uncharacterized protein (TIGR02646 family)
MRHFQREPLTPSIQSQLYLKESSVFKLTGAQRKEVISKLKSSQKSLCAYCECRIEQKKVTNRKDEENFHIEHFEEQNDGPDKRFHYSNFLLSCKGERDPITKPEDEATTQYRRANTTCGFRKEKDRHGGEKIDYDLLLNPTNDVSSLFSYLDGFVEPNNKCSEYEAKQVEYTKKRLNLDAFRLNNARKFQITQITEQLFEKSELEQKAFIQDLLDETQAELNPYFSTIKDNFGFMII